MCHQETAERYPNVELHHAYIPDPFGTHHSKMLVLFRHDDTAQVVIHTANMIPRVCKIYPSVKLITDYQCHTGLGQYDSSCMEFTIAATPSLYRDTEFIRHL
jgi:hypothetical protein